MAFNIRASLDLTLSERQFHWPESVNPRNVRVTRLAKVPAMTGCSVSKLIQETVFQKTTHLTAANGAGQSGFDGAV